MKGRKREVVVFPATVLVWITLLLFVQNSGVAKLDPRCTDRRGSGTFPWSSCFGDILTFHWTKVVRFTCLDD